MNNAQKSELAGVVIQTMGDLLEFWGEGRTAGLAEAGITYEDAREALSTWAKRFPGNVWDTRLGE